jgi:predicted RNA-binding Zn ribbon-like protein
MARQVNPEVRPMPLPVLVRLVNDWGDAPRAVAGKSDEAYPDMPAFRAEFAEYWERFGRLNLGDFTRVANLIRPVFESDSGVACATRVNQLMAQARISPEFGADGWTVRERWNAPREEQLLASAALALIEQLRTDPDAGRLGICMAHDCAGVYVDQSPGARRHYCSLTCQNRSRARTYRARRREAATHPLDGA